MRDLLKKFRNGVVTGLGFVAVLIAIPVVNAAVQSFTLNGSSTTLPITGIPGTIGDFNALVSSINNEVGSYIAFNNSIAESGEFALTNSATWAPTSNIAATFTASSGPTGGHTSIQEWIVVVDNNGNPRFIPTW